MGRSQKNRFNAVSENFSDAVSFDLHQLVAVRLRDDSTLIELVKSRLSVWILATPNVAAWIEWRTILETRDIDSILEIITGSTDDAQRLRSSSPFAGLISPEERSEIIKRRTKTQSF